MADPSHPDGGHRTLEQRARLRREARSFQRRLAILLIALVGVIVAGTVALSLVEHYSLGYGFVLALDTVTTLGSIQTPHNTSGRVVIVALEILGIGTLFYGLATVAEFFVSGQLTGLLGERRTQRMIDSYSDHVIVCGFGRVGRQVARDLQRAGVTHGRDRCRAHQPRDGGGDGHPLHRELRGRRRGAASRPGSGGPGR